MAKKKDIIKILNSNSRDNLSGLTGDNLEVGELALITEADYERLYCKNNDNEIVPIHRIADAGEIVVPFIAEPCTYTTTGASQSVQLINKQEYTKKITLEDGTDIPITGTGELNYTFPDAGEHKVTIEFKEDVTDFSYCFDGCSGLTSIPETLFVNNTAATNFYRCFYGCTSLTSIPENLFANNTAVNSFYNCFNSCTGLTSIPENLFSTNTAVTNFTGCFYGCTKLTNIPENLFSTNTAVTNFTGCFRDCTGLTGNCPIDNDGTPIYNRSGEGKEGYAKVTNYSGCFYNCSGLTDYNSIPSDWGGGGV